MDFALLYDGQKCISGWGNHRSLHQPEGRCFWINNFETSHERPWKCFENNQESSEIPSEFIEHLKFAKGWNCFDEKQFKNLWERAQEHISIHGLHKVVLALSDRSNDFYTKNVLPSFGSRAGFFYAFKIQDDLVWGYTPELFFKKNFSSLETVALAGTYKFNQLKVSHAKNENLKNNLSGERERALDFEHSVVVEYFQKLAKSLNVSLSFSERQELVQGNIAHLQTKICFENFHTQNINEFISHMHPTPALGVYPKNNHSLKALYSLRNHAELPSFYGAPFGFCDDSTALFVVMIRGHFFENNFNHEKTLKRTIGVGITKYSTFEEEWAELEQKRKSMELLWNH